jgi:hypothetical protein
VAGVAPLSRLWFALPGGDTAGLERLAAALGRRPLARVVAATDRRSRHLAETLARAGAGDAAIAPELSEGTPASLEVLAHLAAQHADGEIAVVAPESTLDIALRVVLGLGADDACAPVRPRPGALYAFDWPTGQVDWARPRLVGCDLDWLPPWRSGSRHARYPGGPAAAGSSRT